MRSSLTCQVTTAGPGRERAFATIRRERELARRRYRPEPAGAGPGVIGSFRVIWLPVAARLAEDLLMRDRDRRREAAMRTTLNRIKDLAEPGAAPADRPGGDAAPHA